MPLTTLKNNLNAFLWEQDIDALPGWKSSLISMLRIFSAVARDIAGGLPTLRAMSLVYTTLLSLVPLLAVSFSVLKGFGVHNQVEPMLLRVLAPLGDKGAEITEQIIGFVDNIKVGVLGAVGLGLLLYTVVSLIKKVESAFNFTWRISHPRSIAESFTNYLSVIMVGPVLVFAAMGVTATVSNSTVINALNTIEPFGTLLTVIGKLLPYLLIIAAFAFIYKLIPNTTVKIKSAFYGAVVAGFLWETAGWLFAAFVANSTNYTAVYSGFAILIVFMIWLYLSWMILLTGSSIAFYHQHPERVSDRQQVLALSCRLREKLALMVMQKIASSFHYEGGYHTIEKLARELDVSSDALAVVLDALEGAGLIIRSGAHHNEYVPARSIENISLLDVMDTARAAQETATLNPGHLRGDDTIDTITGELDSSYRSRLEGRTLHDLIG